MRDAFALAKEKAPAIIFIDELDAVGTKRFDSELSGDREVQRTMLELLNQLDGFSSSDDIKASGAPASLRGARRLRPHERRALVRLAGGRGGGGGGGGGPAFSGEQSAGGPGRLGGGHEGGPLSPLPLGPGGGLVAGKRAHGASLAKLMARKLSSCFVPCVLQTKR